MFPHLSEHMQLIHSTPNDGDSGYSGTGIYLLSSCGSNNKPFGTTK